MSEEKQSRKLIDLSILKEQLNKQHNMQNRNQLSGQFCHDFTKCFFFITVILYNKPDLVYIT